MYFGTYTLLVQLIGYFLELFVHKYTHTPVSLMWMALVPIHLTITAQMTCCCSKLYAIGWNCKLYHLPLHVNYHFLSLSHVN